MYGIKIDSKARFFENNIWSALVPLFNRFWVNFKYFFKQTNVRLTMLLKIQYLKNKKNSNSDANKLKWVFE